MRLSHTLLSASTSTTSAQLGGEGSTYEFSGGIHLSNFTAAERALNAITHTNFFFMQKKKRLKEFLFYLLSRQTPTEVQGHSGRGLSKTQGNIGTLHWGHNFTACSWGEQFVLL